MVEINRANGFVGNLVYEKLNLDYLKHDAEVKNDTKEVER